MSLNFLRVPPAELDTYLADSQQLETRFIEMINEKDPNLLNIDKSWDGIRFLLAAIHPADGNVNLERVIFSGQLVDPQQDLGYGPAHYLLPDEVAQLCQVFLQINEADLQAKFDPATMNAAGLYPGIWEEGDEALEYLTLNFIQLQAFYKAAQESKQVIIAIIS